MSVTTTADDRLDSARNHIKEAINDLWKVLDQDTWGSDDYPKEFKQELLSAYIELLSIKEKIN